MRELLRRFRFRPYRKGMGPTFTIEVFDANREDFDTGHRRMSTRLTMHVGRKRQVIFEDFSTAVNRWTCVDSKRALKHAAQGPCIEPGDTDSEFFEDYTPEQLDFATSHGEALECAIFDRFGWDD